ncbi:hypothetical protein [Paenibacillus polymyxa]|nr:hypothetical protein [Paenibacillus polymyxa]
MTIRLFQAIDQPAVLKMMTDHDSIPFVYTRSVSCALGFIFKNDG